MNTSSRGRQQQGNALWFILVAIVLLGALTVLVSRSGTDVNQSGDFERRQVMASQLLRYAKGIEEAVRSMQSRGVSESDISFENTVIAGYEHTPAEPDDHRVFGGGGGQTYMVPSLEWLDKKQSANAGYREWLFTGKLGVADNSSSITPRDTSLVMILPYISREMCMALNRMMRHDGFDGDTPIEDDTSVLDIAGLDKFNGDATDYELAERIDGAGTSYPVLPVDLNYWKGKHAGCARGSDAGGGAPRYVFFQTLIVR